MSNTIRLLLADDHPVVRKGLCLCLAQHPHLQVVAEAADGKDALRKVRDLQPDVVLMDLDMPNLNGLMATEKLRRDFPDIKVLILSSYVNTEFSLRVAQSGARGYVLKEAPTAELVQAIEAVASGKTFFSPEVARVTMDQLVVHGGKGGIDPELTSREREVLACIARGNSNKEIASELGVGVRTIETHRERLMRKLNIHTVAGLTRFALSQGLVSLRPQDGLPSKSRKS